MKPIEAKIYKDPTHYNADFENIKLLWFNFKRSKSAKNGYKTWRRCCRGSKKQYSLIYWRAK
ncbi:hypothetical protein ASE92_06475 [Pedobacter sp. Leaf41]|nr:hypothetical protein ASE92_06475 [Pedobacter sp. Leaf41]